MKSDEPTTRRDPTRRLPEGAVLGGRYRVMDEVARVAGGGVYEGEDVVLAGRRVLVVELLGEDRDRIARAWLDADTPWTATVLDVVGLEGSVAGIFQLDADAVSLHRAGGASREQRAGLLVDVARVLERTADTPWAYHVVAEGLLWVEGLPVDSRLRAVPVPAPGAVPDDRRADELAAFARLTGSQLFGLDPSTPPARALDAIPEPIVSALAPLYDDERAVRLAGGFSASGLEVALGVTSAASRVPVPRAPAAPPDVRARVQSARARVRRRTIIDVLVALGLLLAGVILGGRLLGTDVSPVPPVVESPPVAPVVPLPRRPQDSAVDAPRSVMPLPSDVTWPADAAAFFETADADGVVPRGLGRIATPARRAAWRPHVRIFEDSDGRVTRVERFDAGDHLIGFDTFEWDVETGELVHRRRFTSAGRPVEVRTFDWAASTYRDVRRDGSPVTSGCPTIRFELDSMQRFLSRTCLRADGTEGTFLEGHTVERYALPSVDIRGARARTVRYFDAAERPVTLPGGVAAVRETTDMRGQIVTTEYLDAEGVAKEDDRVGAAVVRNGWAARTWSTQYEDTDGASAVGADGTHQTVRFYDERGGLRALETQDLHGRPVAPVGSTIARSVFGIDGAAYASSVRYFDERDRPTVDRNGVHERRFARDAHGNVLRECDFSTSGPVTSAALGDAHCVTREYAATGLLAAERYFGVDGKPANATSEFVHRVRYAYDESDRLTGIRYFDEDDVPMVGWTGIAGIDYAYDDAGNLRGESFVDFAGKPVRASSGATAVRFTVDEHGREIRRCYLDDAGALVALELGAGASAACVVTEWSRTGAVRWLRYRGIDDAPVDAELPGYDARGEAAPLHAAEVYFQYDRGGRLMRQQWLTTSGRVAYGPECAAAEPCPTPSALVP